MALRPSLTAPPLTIFLAAFLAGCASPSSQADPESTVEESAPFQETPEVQAAPEPDPILPVTLYCAAERTNVGTPAPYGVNLNENRVCDFADLDADLSQYASALVEVTWASLQPTITAIDLYIHSDECYFDGINECRVAGLRSSSGPLVLTLSGHDYATHAPTAWVTLAPEGLSNEQAFDVYLTVFADAEVPAGFTAIPA